MFRDREEAGSRLAVALRHLRNPTPVVLALPRGGVPVAFPVARVLDAPLDLVLVRKVGVPWRPELAAAAVVNGERCELVVNEEVVRTLGISQTELREAAQREVREIERRRQLYLGGRAPAPVAGRTAIVVDDGIATGATVRAALRAVRRRGPGRLVLAVPVAPPDTLAALEDEVDELVCLASPPGFLSIGGFYDDFRQLGDAEVRELLARADAAARSDDAGPP